MSEYIKEREVQRKREYHRRWRAEHRDSVKAAQLRYWTRKVQRMQEAASQGIIETRQEDC